MNTNNSTKKLFFALWPDADQRQQVAAVSDGLLGADAGRQVPVENIHITLVYLGLVEASRLECIKEKAGELKAKGFRLVLDHIGYWSKPRILWLGSRETPEALVSLVAGLVNGMAKCGLSTDKRPYQAHLTLARKAKRPVTQHQIAPVAWDFTGFSLIESVPARHGVEYRELADWPLS